MRDALQVLGGRIRALRTQRGWSQERLAEAAELHENYISRIETGRQEPGFLVLLRLCLAFDLTPAQLLDEFTLSALHRLRR